MIILLTVLCVCLLIALTFLINKIHLLKTNIRHFSDELEKLKDTDYAQPIKISTFDKDIVTLAVKVNEQTSINRKLSSEYQQNKKQLSTVISGISHDFRTPLTASIGYLQMIEKSRELSDKQNEYLNIAIHKNKYLKDLSDEFFEVSKLKSSNEKPDLKPANISNVITEIILEQNSWIEKNNIRTEFDIQDAIMIQTDLHLLRRIMNNLMSNAKKYTSDYFGVRLKNDDKQTVVHLFNSLTDTASVDINRVFEPFYRMDSRTTDGSGLGLYVVKLLCEQLGYQVVASLDKQNYFSIKIII